MRNVPVQQARARRRARPWSPPCSTCWLRNYGIDRGLGGDSAATTTTTTCPTPGLAGSSHRRAARQSISTAREFADNAAKTHGKSMVIIGAAINHWYHNDMIYRGMHQPADAVRLRRPIGGGLAHYVGQEKLRPQAGWAPIAFALDWQRPPRHMNSHVLLLCPHRPVALRERLHDCRRSVPPARPGQ